MKGLNQLAAFRLSALCGFLGVALGAFGAHALEAFLVAGERLGTWETAVLYHLVHSVVLLVLASARKWRSGAWHFFFSGVAIFSGSLYLLCLTGLGWLGAVTPVGGLALILGWLSLLRGPVHSPDRTDD